MYAYAEDASALDGRGLGLDSLDIAGESGRGAGGRVLFEKGAKVLLLLLRVGRVPISVSLALQPVAKMLISYHSMGQGSPLKKSGM